MTGIELPTLEKNEVAGFGERFLAVIADNSLVILLPMLIAVGTFISVTGKSIKEIRAGHVPGSQYLVVSSALYLILLPAIYHAWFWSKSGMTPGKRLAGIRIIRDNGERLTYARALGRAYFMWIYRIPFFQYIFLIISTFMIILGKKKKAIHDMVCGTIVIKNKMEFAQQGAQPDAGTGSKLTP